MDWFASNRIVEVGSQVAHIVALDNLVRPKLMAQLLHFVFGGKVKNPRGLDFTNLEDLELVGVFPNYQTAYDAWRGKSQASIDDAFTKYVIVHLHRMFEPEVTED